MLSLTISIARKLHYKMFEAPKGYGQVYTAEECDEKYRRGAWDFLETINELATFSAAIGYVRYFSKTLRKSAPRILDLGCGTGHFAELLNSCSYGRYVGLDLSSEAVRRAEERNLPNAEFCVSDFTNWNADEKFDFIISTGSICYANDPVAVLKKYRNFLTDDGLFIIALWRYGYNGVIWKNIEGSFELIDATVVSNQKEQTWDVKILR